MYLPVGGVVLDLKRYDSNKLYMNKRSFLKNIAMTTIVDRFYKKITYE